MTDPQEKTRQYLETQVRTATREQLLLLLFDGVIRFATLARTAIEEEDTDAMHTYLVRAQRIVVELMSSLDQRVGDRIYSRLIQLYKFIYIRLVNANLHRSPVLIDEAMPILEHLRETWRQAIDKMMAEGHKRLELAPHHLGQSRGLDVSG